MGLVALLVLVGVVEPELGCLVVLVGHPWVPCTFSVGELPITVCFLVVDVTPPTLNYLIRLI